MNETQVMNETGIVTEINKIAGGFLPDYLGDYRNLIIAALIILCSVVIARIVYFFVERYFKRLAAKTSSKADDRILELIHTPIYYVIILIGIQVAVSFLLVSGTYLGWFTKFVVLILIALVTWVAAGIADIFLKEFGAKLARKTESTLDDEAIPFLSRVVKAAIYFIGMLIILGEFGVEITPLIASLGIAGFAIGFAAKDTLSNLLAGFFILTDRPFVRGDRIQVGQSLGEVVDIGLRTTKIQTLDHTYIIIPNEKIILNEVTNFAMPDIRLKVKLLFGVAYGTEIEKVKRIVLDIAKGCDLVLKDPTPSIFFHEFGESSINFILIIWVTNFRDRLRATDEINTGVYDEFAKQGIEIPYPCRNLYMRKE
ncbi:MAG: mechanosensitive ion channel family protein [Candidatus Altiarchaeota archaeon]|nr:mechanosensitive ion channel family protein [Candidatus Altiarchaeota archaeon]